jgi:hypothetical protein
MDVDIVRRVNIALLKMMDPVSAGVLNVKRNVFVHFTPFNLSGRRS